MIAVAGGLGAAFAFGIAITAYSRSSRLLGPFVVVGWVMLIGLLIVVPAVLLFGLPVTFTAESAFWLAMVGAGNVIGLLLEFRALKTLQVGVIATIVSTEGAIAAVFAILAGEPLSIALALALAVVTMGVVLTTIVPGELADLERPSTRPAVLLAVAAATLFGLGLFATGRVSEAVPVIWILVPARVIGVFGIALPLALGRRLPMVRPAVPLVVIAGVAEVVGFASFAIGARESVAVSAVLVSQFATVSLVLGWFLFRERLSGLQLTGVALVIVGVAAVILVQA